MKTDCSLIHLIVDPTHIDLLNKIIEGYEHLGVLSTLDPRQGLVVVRVTPDTREDLRFILDNLPFPILIKS